MPDKYFRTYSPRVRVRFKDLATDFNADDYIVDASDDLVSLSTNKAYGRAAGTWQLMLTYRLIEMEDGSKQRYNEILEPDNVVTIEIDMGDGDYWPVMLGLIDRVSVVYQGGPVPQRQVKISGQDYGKLLAKHNIGWNPTVLQYTRQDNFGKESPWESFIRYKALEVGTPPELIDKLFKIFKEDMPEPANRIDRDGTCTDDWRVHNESFTQIAQQSTWDAMKKCEHDPFNVLHCDTSRSDVNKFKLILEDQPIDYSGYLSRTEGRIHTIDETEIIMSDVGISDAERVNVLCYWPEMYSASIGVSGVQIGLAHPDLTIVDAADDNKLQLHATHAKIHPDNFVPPDQKEVAPTDATEAMDAFYNAEVNMAGDSKLDAYNDAKFRLWNMWNENHKLEAGTYQLHVRPDIRAGHCLLVRIGNTAEYMEYLVEQVSHQCTFHPAPQFVTTLQVTRGQKAPESKVEKAAPPELPPPEKKPEVQPAVVTEDGKIEPAKPVAEDPAPEKPAYDCAGTRDRYQAAKAKYTTNQSEYFKTHRLSSANTAAFNKDNKSFIDEMDAAMKQGKANGCDTSAW